MKILSCLRLQLYPPQIEKVRGDLYPAVGERGLIEKVTDRLRSQRMKLKVDLT